MSERYVSKHSKKSSQSKTIAVVAVIAVLIAALGAGAYYLITRFISPKEAPAADRSTQAVTQTVTEAPTQAPTEAPTADPVQAYIGSMSTYEKICQLFVVTTDELTGESGVTLAGEQTKAALEKYPVGGIIYSYDNLVDTEQTKALISDSQSFSRIPLFIAVDEEGGSVARVAYKLGTTQFDDMYSYRDKGTQTASDNAETIAKDISQLGFNLDFAPIADVWTNPENTVIAERAYSDDYDQAAELVAAAVEGFNKGGVIPTLKHFPGHGDTFEDSHNGLATVNKTLEELKAGELLPFKSGIEAGAGMVMVGHLSLPEIDPDRPATLSKTVIPTLLRGELGYDGVVITDGMGMGAIVDYYDFDQIVRGIFDADIDMILGPYGLDSYISAIEAALADGSITEEQLDRKVTRILTLKKQRGLFPEQ